MSTVTRKRKGFSSILILGLVLVAGIFLSLIYKNFGVKTFDITIPNSSPNSSKEQDGFTNADKEDWKSYEGRDFSFKYPKNYNFSTPVIIYNFEVKNSEELINYTTLGRGRLLIRFDKGYGSDENSNLSKDEQENYTRDWSENYFKSWGTIKETGELVLSGVKSPYAITCSDYPANNEAPCIYQVVVPFGKDSINIEVHGDLSLKPEFDQILSTFKFSN